MSVNLSLAALFEEAFGYQSSAFEPKFDTVPAKLELGKFGAKYWEKGLAGREYFLPVSLNVGASLADFLGDTNNDGVPSGIYKLPYPIIEATNQKIIIDTPMTERSGMVSEYINSGGWRIRIRGFMIGEGQNFPERDLAIFSKLESINKPVLIDCALTDILLLSPDRKGSDEVVIRSLNFPAIKGVQHVRPYEMELTSNEPFNLIEIN